MEVKRNFMRVACSDMIVKQRLVHITDLIIRKDGSGSIEI